MQQPSPAIFAEWREHDAVVRSNRPDGSLAWSLEVTHEGDDAHERRLGDLREECRLDLYAAVLARGIKPPAFYAMKAVMDICTSRLIGWGTYADHPVFAVHAQDGSRRQSLRGDLLHGGEQSIMPLAPLLDWPYLLRDRTYFVHELMTDATWSDEAVLHFVFTDDPPDDAAPATDGAAP